MNQLRLWFSVGGSLCVPEALNLKTGPRKGRPLRVQVCRETLKRPEIETLKPESGVFLRSDYSLV